MLEIRPYQKGDFIHMRNISFDPFALFGPDAELTFSGLRTIWDGDTRVCVAGFAAFMPGVVGSFAAVDRVAAKGQARALVDRLRCLIGMWAPANNVHRVEATCSSTDRTAQVFLRAIGFRFESVVEAGAPDGTDLHQFKIIFRRNENELS